jgi:hypothetical protein
MMTWVTLLIATQAAKTAPERYGRGLLVDGTDQARYQFGTLATKDGDPHSHPPD